MNADRLAHWYRWVEYAAFGRALERSRFAFLERLANARRVLVFGEGDGRALQRLLAVAPAAQVDVIETSAKMIALAQERIGSSERVKFFPQDARSIALPHADYDAVITFFFLDCFDAVELRELLKRIEPNLTPGAIWLMSDFAIPARGWRRGHATVWIWVMYHFFRVATGLGARTLPPMRELLGELGLQQTDVRPQRWGLILSEALVYRRSNG